MQLARIAVGTDFSEDSERAVAQALAIAEASGAEVHIIHMVGPLDPPPVPAGSRDRYEERLDREVERAKRELDKLGARYASAETRVHYYANDGEPDFGLVETAKELEAELLIIGSHGRTGYKRVLMGSVAERVVRLAKLDVMVARLRPSGGFKKILVPIDFSAASERALRAAVDLVEPDGTVHLAHFWSGRSERQGRGEGHEQTESFRSEARARLRELADASGGKTSIATFEEKGAAVPGILTALEQARDYDLVMMGSHGARRRERWLMGTVAERIVRYAPCSVWVVRPPPAEPGNPSPQPSRAPVGKIR